MTWRSHLNEIKLSGERGQHAARRSERPTQWQTTRIRLQASVLAADRFVAPPKVKTMGLDRTISISSIGRIHWIGHHGERDYRITTNRDWEKGGCYKAWGTQSMLLKDGGW